MKTKPELGSMSKRELDKYFKQLTLDCKGKPERTAKQIKLIKRRTGRE